MQVTKFMERDSQSPKIAESRQVTPGHDISHSISEISIIQPPPDPLRPWQVVISGCQKLQI